ncbi:RNA-binding protein EWS-like [Zophobas morio]|uniref:RNA-binding protein EWS-like n=1 Tax=Zophobas morio TaxID=2755281 RepID=UPI003083B305
MKCLLALLLLFRPALCAESVYMKHAEIDDQESSASGYAYQLHSGGPLYAYPVAANGVGHFAYPPLLGRYTQQLPFVEYKPQAPVGVVPLNYGIQAHPYALHYPLQTQAFRPAPIAAPVPVSDSSNFEKGGGSSYSDANQSAHGEKGSTGYKTAEEYDKGAQGQHDSKGHKEFYNEQGGNKANHHDQAAHYGQKEEASKGSQGSHFSQSKSHKKGSKTKGYHRVHHKDEFKKDHSFYDESDASGQFSKHGDYDANHASHKGGFEKGGHEDGAYQQGEQGVKGFVDKGHFNGQNSGFKGEEGKEAFYKNFQDFGKKGEEQEGKEFGYSKKDLLQALQ